MLSRFRGSCAFLLLAFLPGFAFAEVPLAQAGRGPAPVVDGRLDDAGWQSCAQLFPFVEAEGKGLAATQTRALVFSSESALHIAFRCKEPKMGKLVALRKTHDSGVWRDDCVEIFLQRPGQKGFYHVIVNALGVTYDARSESDRWNPAIEVKAFREKNAWGIELSLPWADLGGRPQPGEVWRANFCRERKVESELSCWGCTYGKFLKPERFGELVFTESAVRLETFEMASSVPGANQARLKFKLPGPARAEVQATGGKTVPTAPGGGPVELVYPLGLSAGEIVFAVRVGGRAVWRAALPVDIRPRPALDALNQAIRNLGQLEGRLQEGTSLHQSFAKAMGKAGKAAGAMQAAVRQSLEKGIPLAKKQYVKLNAAAAAETRALSQLRWPIWTKNCWLDLKRSELPPSAESISELNFTSLVNEYESGNVILTNLSASPLQLRITASEYAWLAPLPADRHNLVRNPGLEEDANEDKFPDGWFQATGARDSHKIEEAGEHGKVLAIERAVPGKSFTVRQALPLEAGRRYTLYFDAKCESAIPNVYVKVINSGWTYATGSRAIGGTHGWRRMQFAFSMPESPAYQLVIYDAGGGTGNIWLDDFILVQGDSPNLAFAGVRPALAIPDWQQVRGGKSVADPLIPLDRSGRLDIPPGESRQVWITLPARDLPPGQYTSSLTFQPLATGALQGSPPAKTVSLRLDLKPLRLDTSPDFAVYNWDYARDEDYVRDLFLHKVNFYLTGTGMPSPGFDKDGNPEGEFDYSSYDRLLRIKMKYARKAGGQILFSYGIIRDFHQRVAKKYGWKFRDRAWDKAFRSTYSHWLEHLKALGLSYEEYSVQVWDEATGPNIDYVIGGGKLLREIDPKVRLVMDGAQSLAEVKRIDPYIDVWIPHLHTLLRRDPGGELLEYYKQTGEPVYTYTCSTFMKALPPYEYHRLKPWYAARLGLDGVFYWAYNSWRGNPWDDFDGPIADCGVIYPSARGPITSRRWEGSREGIEDWQLIRLLRRLAKGTPAAAPIEKLISQAIEAVLAEPADTGRARASRRNLISAAAKLAARFPLSLANIKPQTGRVQAQFLGKMVHRNFLSVTFDTNRPAGGILLFRLKGTARWESENLLPGRIHHLVKVLLPPEAAAEWLILAWDRLGRVAFTPGGAQLQR